MADVPTPTDEAGATDQERWKPEELELRQEEIELRHEEIRYNRKTARLGTVSTCLQAVIAVAAIVAAGAAYDAARDASEAVDVASDGVRVAAEGVERQSAEARLATAVAATGGDQAGERSAGFRLLQHLASREMAAAEDPGEQRDAHSLYGTSLDVLEVFLRNGPSVPMDSATDGHGYGYPAVPPDNFYAAGVLSALMTMKKQVLGLDLPAPSVDLSRVQLRGVHWPEIDFAWLGGHNFPGIDLRGATLRESVWGELNSEGKPRGSNLAGAFLQCAILTEADLIGVNLKNADLRGADLRGADLTGASLGGADLRAADLTDVEGLTRDQLAGARWDITTDGLEGFGPPTGQPEPAPANTDGTCIGDYQAIPGS